MIKEVHFGQVLDNQDPDKRGGLKVQVNTLVDGAALVEEFIPPSFPFAGKKVGFFFVPAVGAQVEVEVESDPEKATEGIFARWRATLYSEEDDIPEEFAKSYPQRGGIKFGDEVFLMDAAQGLTALISAKVRLGEEEASHPLMRGDTFNQQLDTYLTAEKTYLTAVNTLATASIAAWTALEAAATGLLAPLATPFMQHRQAWQTFAPQIVTYQSAVNALSSAASSWLSTKCRTE